MEQGVSVRSVYAKEESHGLGQMNAFSVNTFGCRAE